MTNRSLTAASLTAIGAGKSISYNLVQMDFPSPQYLTDAPYNITHLGNVYVADGTLTKVPKIKETLKIKPSTISIEFSGASLVSHALTLTNYRHIDVFVYKFIKTTEQVITVFEGFIDSHSSNEDTRGGSATVTWKVTNHWANWERKNGRKITDQSQKRLFPNDDGFKFAGVTESVSTFWGDKPFVDISNYVPFEEGYGGISGDYYDQWMWGVDKNWSNGKYDWESAKAAQNHLPIAYGRTPISGTPVFRTVTGTNGSKLWVVYALCEGEVDGLENIYFKGKSDTSSPITENINVTFYNGTDSQVANAALIAASPDWTSNCTLSGVCYAIIEYTKNEAWSGEPDPQFLIRGKKVFDPRNSTTTYLNGRNNALVLRDYLTNSRYGKNIQASYITNSRIEACANICDELNFDHDAFIGGSPLYINRYRFNGIVDTGDKILDNVNKILFSMIGYLPWINGEYSLLLEAELQASTYDFDSTNISGNISYSVPSIKSIANSLTYEFKDSRENWADEVQIISSATFLAEDNNILLEIEVSNQFETNKYRARNIGETLLKMSREQGIIRIDSANAEAIKIEVGNIIRVTRESKQWTLKKFRVTDISISSKNEVSIIAIEYEPSVADWAVSVEQATPTNSTLNDPFFTSAPTLLQLFSGTDTLLLNGDGSLITRIKGTFVKTDDAFVGEYIVLVKLSTETVYRQVATINSKDEPEFFISPCAEGLTYNVRLYAVNTIGVRSASVDLNHLALGKSVPPSAPTNLVVGSVDLGIINLAWTEISDLDLDFYEVWASASNDRATSSKVGTAKGGEFNHGTSTNKYYWIRAIDTSGLVSTWTPNTTAGVLGSPDGLTTNTEWADILDTAGTKPDNNATLGAEWDINVTGEALPDSFNNTDIILHSWIDNVDIFTLLNASLDNGLYITNSGYAVRVFQTNPKWTWDKHRFFSCSFTLSGVANHSTSLYTHFHCGGVANGANNGAGLAMRRVGSVMQMYGYCCDGTTTTYTLIAGATFLDNDNIRFELKTNGGVLHNYAAYINGTAYTDSIFTSSTPSGTIGANFIPYFSLTGAAVECWISDYYFHQYN